MLMWKYFDSCKQLTGSKPHFTNATKPIQKQNIWTQSYILTQKALDLGKKRHYLVVGDKVIDINSREEKSVIRLHLIEPLNFSGGLKPHKTLFILQYLVGLVFNPSLMMVSTIWNSALSVELGSRSSSVFS